TAWAVPTPATCARPTCSPTRRTTPTPATACRRRRSRWSARTHCRRSPVRPTAMRCTSSRSATAAAGTCSRRRWPGTRPRCANTSAATARSTDRNDGAAIASALRFAGRRRGRRQDHGAARAARRAAGRGRRSRRHPRTGRHAAGGDDPRPAARPRARTARGRDRVAADVRRARPARARNDPARARTRRMGDQRPLHRFELRLPGRRAWTGRNVHRRTRAPRGRPAARPDPAAGRGRRPRPRAHPRPRPGAGCERPGPDRARARRVLRTRARDLSRARRRRAGTLPGDRRLAARGGRRRTGRGAAAVVAGAALMDGPAGQATFAPWQKRAYERARAALDSGRLGHALLLCGPERLGKRAVAEALAQYALCTGKETGGAPCGHCRSCRLFGARAQRDPVEVRPDGTLAHPAGHSSHPDLILVGYEWRLRPSPARQRTEIVIDQMRDLSAQLGLSSGSESGTRVAIVEPADA